MARARAATCLPAAHQAIFLTHPADGSALAPALAATRAEPAVFDNGAAPSDPNADFDDGPGNTPQADVCSLCNISSLPHRLQSLHIHVQLLYPAACQLVPTASACTCSSLALRLFDTLQVQAAVLKSSSSPAASQPLLKASPATSNATQGQVSLPGSAGNPTAIYSTGRFASSQQAHLCIQIICVG